MLDDQVIAALLLTAYTAFEAVLSNVGQSHGRKRRVTAAVLAGLQMHHQATVGPCICSIK